MISQKLYPVSFLEYLAIVHGCSHQIYTGHFNRYSSIEINKADTISCGPPLTSKITCFLPKPKVKALRFTVHISYFLQKCKKAKLPKDDLLKLKNDITTILRPHKRAIYCSKHKFHLICDVIDIFGFEYS